MQITGRYQASVSFCRDKQYKCLLNLNLEALSIALSYQTNLHHVELIIRHLIDPIKRFLISEISAVSPRSTVLDSLLSDRIFSFDELSRIAKTAGVEMDNLTDKVPDKLYKIASDSIQKMKIGLDNLKCSLNMEGLFENTQKAQVLEPILENFIKCSEFFNGIMQKKNRGLSASLRIEVPMDQCRNLLSNYQALKERAEQYQRSGQESTSNSGCNPM
jgi:hypothetical protein